MSNPYVGQLLLVPYNFAPAGWMFCQGQLLPISEYDVLFNLIGTTYGGDGQSTFALPDLRGRTAIGVGQSSGTSNYVQGQVQGVETVTLTLNQMPSHSHPMGASGTAFNSNPPTGAYFGAAAGMQPYGTGGTPANMAAQSVTFDGGSQPHENRQPYLALNWIISLYGVFPPHN